MQRGSAGDHGDPARDETGTEEATAKVFEDAFARYL